MRILGVYPTQPSEDDPQGMAYQRAYTVRRALIQSIGPGKFSEDRFDVAFADGKVGDPQVQVMIAYKPRGVIRAHGARGGEETKVMSYAVLAKKANTVAPSTAAARHPVVSSRVLRFAEANDALEREADRVAESVMSKSPGQLWSLSRISIGNGQVIQRRSAPYIKKIAVHLTPDETADLTWEGTPPSDAPGKDSFTVSTGKGYSDPGDPAGTCKRDCCSDAQKQCAPPWNRPDHVGACCTYVGNNFWTGVPLDEHNGWKWWTPIQPYYSSRGIALHQHTDVTSKPIGHGCVRMDEDNAKRIHDFSNGRHTNVTIDGTAAPVECGEDRQCSTAATGGTTGKLGQASEDKGGMIATNEPVAGLEGVMS